MSKDIFVVYCSPNGSTRHVAQVIQKELQQQNIPFTELALGRTLDWTPVINRIRSVGDNACIFMGSPVYKGLAVPPVIDFIRSLPDAENSLCVPFVTWGAVSSGVALWQMGGAFAEKGYQIAGAAKIVAEHSAMWGADAAPGKGHPDRDDEQAVIGFTATLAHRLNLSHMPALSLSDLDYQPESVAAAMKRKIGAPWEVFDKGVDEEKCTQCGVCEAGCPMDAILLDPFPEINADCFDCLNCIRLCPEEAFVLESPGLPDLTASIRHRAQESPEAPVTEVFVRNMI